MKMETANTEVKTEMEISYVATDQVMLPTLSLENLVEVVRKALH